MIFHIGDVDVELDLNYLDNIDDYYAAIDALSEEMERREDETPLAYIHRCADKLLAFFDTACGEGTAKAAFGERIHIKDLYQSYYRFLDDVNVALDALANDILPPDKSEAVQQEVPQNVRSVKKANILTAVTSVEVD